MVIHHSNAYDLENTLNMYVGLGWTVDVSQLPYMSSLV